MLHGDRVGGVLGEGRVGRAAVVMWVSGASDLSPRAVTLPHFCSASKEPNLTDDCCDDSVCVCVCVACVRACTQESKQ